MLHGTMLHHHVVWFMLCTKNVIMSPCYMEYYQITMLCGMLSNYHVVWLILCTKNVIIMSPYNMDFAISPCHMECYFTMLCGLHYHHCVYVISVDAIETQINHLTMTQIPHLTMPQINHFVYQMHKDHQEHN